VTKITKRLTQALAAAILFAVSLSGALAQSSAETSIHFMRGIGLLTGMTGSCPMMGGMSAYADGRVAFLKTELAITEAQEPVWATYANALKKHLNRMLEVQQIVMQVLEAKAPVERMRSYIKAMENRVASLKDLEPALATLYSALSPDQQKKSNEILTGMGCTM
jgi:hypothetical protein